MTPETKAIVLEALEAKLSRAREGRDAWSDTLVHDPAAWRQAQFCVNAYSAQVNQIEAAIAEVEAL